MSETDHEKKVSETPVEELEAEVEEEEDEELASMKRKFKEMQEEAERLEQMQRQVEDQLGTPKTNFGDSKDADKRSVYVGNVDYGAAPKELQDHFQSCGTINRVTILCDKFSGHPKGFAYVEFVEEEAVQNAMVLNESLFRGRPLKVTPKRTNLPGLGPRGFSAPIHNAPFRFRSRGRFPRPRARRAAYYHPYQ